MFKIPDEKIMTPELLSEFITKHKDLITRRYKPLQDAYMSDYSILRQKKKPNWKPDNRIVVNFAKYIVDTMNGFFIGIPIKVTSDDPQVSDYLEILDAYNNQDDNNAELSKIMSIYGQGYEMYYVDADKQIGITYLDPLQAFIIYDESIIPKPRYFIRYYKDTEAQERGSWSDETNVQYFKHKAGYIWDGEPESHGFPGVPAVEFMENAERQSIFEPVLSMITAYHKAISEKANDVDAFADAYMKILGAKLENGDLEFIRDNRVINFEGEDTRDLIVDFLNKPNGDTTQENLLERLERLIYQISMVANISDENFGTSSGIALRYRLHSMTNLAKTKERKFTAGMNRRYQLIFGNALSKTAADAWTKIKYQFTPNYPANLLEEAEIAEKMIGTTSKETALKVLSIVDNVKEEMERMEGEQDKTTYQTDFPTNRTELTDELLE